RAILENAVGIADILLDLASFDRWKYVLSLVLASGEPGRVDPIMATIARWNPGAASWIINETETAGLSKNREYVSAEDWQEVGSRLRLAVGALLEGLGPLSAVFGPFRITGLTGLKHFSLVPKVSGGSVSTTWLISNQIEDPPLPPVVESVPRE